MDTQELLKAIGKLYIERESQTGIIQQLQSIMQQKDKALQEKDKALQEANKEIAKLKKQREEWTTNLESVNAEKPSNDSKPEK